MRRRRCGGTLLCGAAPRLRVTLSDVPFLWCKFFDSKQEALQFVKAIIFPQLNGQASQGCHITTVHTGLACWSSPIRRRRRRTPAQRAT